jgi:hypothetical protein
MAATCVLDASAVRRINACSGLRLRCSPELEADLRW